MTVRTLTRPVDTTTRRAKPASALSGLSYLEVKRDDSFAYLFFPVPFSLGATVISATLRVWSYAAPDTGRTLTARRVHSKVNYARMTHDTRPLATGASAEEWSSTSGPAQLWELDVTRHMQEVSAGEFWWGFRVESSSTQNPLRLHSSQSQYAGYRPVLVVEWADEPDIPGDLAPAGNLAVSEPKPVLRFTYSDHGGRTEQAGVHVRVASNQAMTADVWDSGERFATAPELDLEDTDFPGLPASGATRWWQVRVKDAAGLWSKWSDAAAVRYLARGLVEITEPTSSQLMDSTPVVRWSFTGTQEQYRVIVQRGDKIRIPVWDSGRLAGTETSFTVPDGILRDDKTYTITVQVWDTEDRASTPGAPAFRQSSATFWFDEDLAVPAADTISATPRGHSPFVDVEWTATATPDAFMLTREGVILGRWEPDEVRTGPETYSFVDRTCPPGVEQRYRVRAIVGTRRSGGRSQVCVARTTGVWLTTPVEGGEVCLTGQEVGSPTLGVRETVHEVGERVIVVRDALRGHEGEWSGQLHSDISIAPGVSAKQWRDRLMAIRRDQSGVRLHMGPVNVPVILSGMMVRADAAHELSYTASFTYHQQQGPELDDIDTVG